MDLLNTKKFTCSVSSVLNKNNKVYGKKFLYDQEEDTAWNSDEGTPQWINIQFENEQNITGFCIQFQGGFAAKEGQIEIITSSSSTIYQEPFYAEDINAEQTFLLKMPQYQVQRVRFIIFSSTDLFGRIIVYKLKLFGESNNE